jgi:hypothetical protein
MKKYYWSGISKDERVKAMYELTGIIAEYGIILNFLRYSDISIGLSIELESGKVHDFYSSLESMMIMEGFDRNLTDTDADCMILMNVTFIKGTGDLAIEVPAVIE